MANDSFLDIATLILTIVSIGLVFYFRPVDKKANEPIFEIDSYLGDFLKGGNSWHSYFRLKLVSAGKQFVNIKKITTHNGTLVDVSVRGQTTAVSVGEWFSIDIPGKYYKDKVAYLVIHCYDPSCMVYLRFDAFNKAFKVPLQQHYTANDA